jgi:probable phosphoglycerate mutase
MTKASINRELQILLVRHGESVWNFQNLIQGQSPLAPGLTRAGMEQARTAADLIGGTDARLVLSSDLRRAVETAKPIACSLKARLDLDPRLRERALGEAEGQPSDSIDAGATGLSGELVTNVDAHPPGGESLRQLYARVAGFVDDLFSRRMDGPVVLVTHGGVVRVLRAYLAGIRPEQMKWEPVLNAFVIRVVASKADASGYMNCETRLSGLRAIYEAGSQESVGKFTRQRGTI